MAFTLSASTGIVGFETNETGLLAFGRINSVPPAGLDTTASTYSAGCMIMDSSTGIIWINTGTVAAPVWNRMGSAAATDPKLQQYAEVDISSANITDTGAGHLGHANGVILVPAAPTGYINVLDSAVLSYTFGVAQYTGGGNITVNIGGGGAALTGLVSFANSIGNAASKILQFVPLATAAIAHASAESINLVSVSAPTQPGTAVGTVKVHVWWTQVPA
jgi:hypothetical protein